jgi:hypothetical protein
MTATLAACRSWLEHQVGTVETGGPDGHSGNHVRYWDDIGRHDLQGSYWCGALMDAMAKATGLKLPGSMIDTTAGALAFQRAGLWVPVSKGGQPGDFTFFAWNGRKDFDSIDHVEWEVKPVPGGKQEDIGGNTSGVGDSGQAQRNGGMVAKRVRDRRFIVGYGRPQYAPAKPVIVMSSNPYNFHEHIVYATQWALDVRLTGRWDKPTVAALIALKKRNGFSADRGVGPKTIALLSQIRHPRQI